MNFSKIENIEHLKELGTISDIKLEINKFINPFTCTSETYDDLLKAILILKVKWVGLLENEPFITERDKYIYILKNTDGKTRTQLLKIKDEYYENFKLAKIWYKKIAHLVHIDKGGDDEAFRILKEIYDNLIEDNNDE